MLACSLAVLFNLCLSSRRGKLVNVSYAQLDVTDYNQFEHAVREAEKKHGKTACLVNNTGVLNVGEFRDMPIDKIHSECGALG
ncbi:SDR family NAD(P)-dependent oxidoreductase [Legionella massiliensis]|uniref:SDR family NAD(P)-dependent oxidoreductase n=1 Tax=Legionella massiliensis TaxID=1034943 RepID=UPI003CCB9A86